MAKFEPNSPASVITRVEEQQLIETELAELYVPGFRAIATPQGGDVPDYSGLPPNFVPIHHRIICEVDSGGSHSTLDIRFFDGHAEAGARARPVKITPSDTRSLKNKEQDFVNSGLCVEPDPRRLKAEVTKQFNASFLDGGDLNRLMAILESLPRLVIPPTKIGDSGLNTAEFDGTLPILFDENEHRILIENSLVTFQGKGGREFPVFDLHEIELNNKNELEPEATLATRRLLGDTLHLPLHLCGKDIEEQWTKHLHNAYDMWASQTKKLCADEGIAVRLPSFTQACAMRDGAGTFHFSAQEQPSDLGTER